MQHDDRRHFIDETGPYPDPMPGPLSLRPACLSRLLAERGLMSAEARERAGRPIARRATILRSTPSL